MQILGERRFQAEERAITRFSVRNITAMFEKLGEL